MKNFLINGKICYKGTNFVELSCDEALRMQIRKPAKTCARYAKRLIPIQYLREDSQVKHKKEAWRIYC
jgi:hypothetical protein